MGQQARLQMLHVNCSVYSCCWQSCQLAICTIVNQLQLKLSIKSTNQYCHDVALQNSDGLMQNLKLHGIAPPMCHLTRPLESATSLAAVLTSLSFLFFAVKCFRSFYRLHGTLIICVYNNN